MYYWLLFEIYQAGEKSEREIVTNFCKHFDLRTADVDKEENLRCLRNFGLIKHNKNRKSYEPTIMGSRIINAYFENIHADYSEYVVFQRMLKNFPFLNQIAESVDISLEEKKKPTLKIKINAALINIKDFLNYVSYINNYWSIPTIFEIIEKINETGTI